MNSGVVSLYKYQSRVYFHEKKHWNIHLSRLFCLIASPLTNLFYSGFDLISTYKDVRLIKTLRESIEALKSGDNVVVFPEDSKNGYLSELEGFHEGFVLLADTCRKKGMDLPVYVSYFRKSDRTYIFDAPVMYSELCARYNSREQIAKYLCNRCNELGKMQFDENGKQMEKREKPKKIKLA
jgi:1-acyl-sn-glycerol-3-phosphate acyltransferase